MTKKATLQFDSTVAKINPVTRAVRHQIQSNRRKLVAAAVLSGATAMPQIGMAQEAIEEVVVTASKRAESMQDVPIAIVALDSQALSDQAITSFEDYALALSNVAFKSFGYPGSATMFMRGAADGGDGNASGSTPSVCLYLDEQPVTASAANLDVHIYDVARIEALAGPQGTLYGASCQSGSLRIISNAPDPSGFSAGFDIGYGTTSGGDASDSIEGFVNLPIGENAAIRVVGWSINDGGWIDAIPGGTRTYNLAATGNQATLTSDAFAKENFNELEKTGVRAALGVNLNDNWTITAGVLAQKIEAEGVWDHDNFNFDEDHVIERYNPDTSEDEFTQLSLTIEGEIGNHSLVYAGSLLDRDSYYESDYSAYGDYITWVDYYSCNWGYNSTEAECTSLNEIATRDNHYERTTHELRLLSLGDSSLQYTVGAFFQEDTHDYVQLWRQPGMVPSVSVPGYATDDVWFRTDQERSLDQTALFGELTYNFTDQLSATVGARWFDEEASMLGVVGWGPYAFDPAYIASDGQAGDPFFLDTFVDLKDSNSDTIYKASLAWNMSDDAMAYFTWSEGYRPGGINRDPGLLISAGTQIWVPDILTNYELGWKSTFADGRVRLNGAVYLMEWEDIQYTIYDGSLSFCCGSTYNLSTAEVKGLEVDVVYAATDGLTFSGSLAFNDAKTTADFVLPSGNLSVPSGTSLPNVPEFKANIVARYEFMLGQTGAFAQLAWSYTGDSTSEITQPDTRGRYPFDRGVWPQASYSIVNFRAGIDKDSWGVDLYVNNVTDEVTEYYVHPRPYEPSTVTNRPRHYGAKLWMRF